MVNDVLKAKIEVEKKIYHSEDSGWGVFTASIEEVTKGEPVYQQFTKNILACGHIYPVKGDKYYITAVETSHPKYGTQYKLTATARVVDFDVSGEEGKKKFLLSILTENQVKQLYKDLEDPFKVFEEQDIESLVKVKGCGIKTATAWVKKFNERLPLSKIYLELEDYDLTTAMMEKLFSTYKSADLVIDTVKNNPYCLVKDVDGIGFVKADEIAMKAGLDPYSCERIQAFMDYYLDNRAQVGHSYIPTSELMGAIEAMFGEDIPNEPIIEALQKGKDHYWCNDSQTYIGLQKYRDLEEELVRNVKRLNTRDEKDYGNWREKIKRLEEIQGWEFAPEQLEGIQAVLENNFVIITGYPGTGKTSIVEAMLAVTGRKLAVGCCLAGRAAARLKEASGVHSSTIHELVDYYGSRKNENNPIEAEKIFVDEFSMINTTLFTTLFKAIRTGSKVILLGDPGQLETIGEGNVGLDLINSGKIKVVRLTKIHRQAARSAIKTKAIEIHEGHQLVEKDFVGRVTLGELEDLTLDCYSDKSNTYYNMLEHFMRAYAESENIFEVQMISPTRKNGSACCFLLNAAAQDLINPEEDDKPEVFVSYGKGIVGIIRKGDKVINMRNNRNVYTPEGKKTAIYNGNMGIVVDISEDIMTIDFLYIGRVIVEKKNFQDIELAYCCTCHKMQGSQADYIIFGVDYSSYTLLSRELVYTAITRAKKKCVVCAETRALRYALTQSAVSEKVTHVVDLMRKEEKFFKW